MPSFPLLLVLSCTCQPDPPPLAEPAGPAPPPPPVITEPPWVASGDVGHDQATLWTMAGGLARVRAEAWRADDPDKKIESRSAMATPAAPPAAPTAHLRLEGLQPGTIYAWRVLTGDGREAEGRLKTAPLPEDPSAVRLLVGGDLGGQGWCRPTDGYAIFDAMSERDADLAILNGDMIYADNDCPPQAPDGSSNVQAAAGHPVDIRTVDWTDAVATRSALDDWWAYHRADPKLQAFLEQVPVIVQWDDHEAVNDWGGWPAWSTGEAERAGFPTLIAQARAALLAWNPIDPEARPGPIHRRIRWGQHLEVFVLDNRSFRSENAQADGPGKTMLGAEQLAWLLAALHDSDATWRVISTSVPLSIPTGSQAWKNGRDGWANGTGDPQVPAGETDISPTTGYEHELGLILSRIRELGRPGVVFVTTDVHHSRVLRYDNGGVPVTEVISGPLRAWSGPPTPLDPTLAPVEHFAVGERFTFASLSITPEGELTIELHDEAGAPLAGSTLTLPPGLPGAAAP